MRHHDFMRQCPIGAEHPTSSDTSVFHVTQERLNLPMPIAKIGHYVKKGAVQCLVDLPNELINYQPRSHSVSLLPTNRKFWNDYVSYIIVDKNTNLE